MNGTNMMNTKYRTKKLTHNTKVQNTTKRMKANHKRKPRNLMLLKKFYELAKPNPNHRSTNQEIYGNP